MPDPSWLVSSWETFWIQLEKQTCGQKPRGTEKLQSTCKDSSGELICMSDTVKSQQFIYDFPKSGKGGISLRYPVVRRCWLNMFLKRFEHFLNLLSFY